ncbi:MAG: hypothetical protein K1X70_19900 [Leptospirales bacterium]|nr:hypothetical protein [Leptospirales bacterium]HNE24339.1 hypothetical protein [Leptospiraceae bacterium]HNJ04759.1 hypothetical protein [Leptospiraceae bacterium]HNL67903.1 hypothetical protein [Leptospiraceae bacterium]HNN59639.1 hypothetical protein [Leptospiraceae bacterium]
MGDRSDSTIALPARMVLTREGLSLFAKNPESIKKVKSRDGMQREGLEADAFNAPTVQKLIMNSYLEEIYVRLPDPLRRRAQIISTNNLVVYAVLYKKLSPSLARMLFESTVVREFNRKNPKNSIVDLKHIPSEKVDGLRQLKPGLFEQMEEEIHADVVDRISSNPALSEEDKSVRVRSLPKFIKWIDKRIWYLYFIIYQTAMKEQMRKAFGGMIAIYLDHTKIATHLSNMLMEFVQNAEKSSLERIMVKNNLARREDVDRMLRDLDTRVKIVEIASKTDQMVDIAWNMNPERNSFGKQYRIQIIVSNYGLIDEVTRSNLARKMKTNVEGINIASFYQDSGDETKLGAGLGLLYNSYLEDICRAEGIQYKCNIFPEPEKEKTTVRVDLTM